MSRILELQEMLQDTGAAIAQTERAVATDPKSPALLAMSRSLRRRLGELEDEFMELADEAGVDVCSYRMFDESDQQTPTILPLTTTLADFQRWLSVVHDALRSGQPKQRMRPSPEAVRESSLSFGYSFSGSIGLVFTVPAQKMLHGHTEIEEAMTNLAEMARLRTSDELKGVARRLGVASVRAMYLWASHHAESRLGADIAWRRGQEVLPAIFIQQAEFEELRDAIAQTSEENVEEITLVGELVAASVKSKTFTMSFPNAEDARGTFEDAIGEGHEGRVPHRYKATMRKTTTLKYSTEEETVSYFLIRLEQP